MPFILTKLGAFSSRLAPKAIEWVIEKQFTRRLIDCSDDAVMLNPARVQALQRLRINVRGKREGVAANPVRAFGSGFSTLRCDKQEDQELEIDGVIIPHAAFLVRLEENAHGGLLCPYDVGFSFAELAGALRESLRGAPESGHALVFEVRPRARGALSQAG